MSAPKVQLLLTGNELMTGDIVDSNSAMMAQVLKDIGLGVNRKVTVADDLALLVNEITYMASTSDILIINGGLGPTVDDLTAQALALAIEDELSQHPQALTHLTNWCHQRGAELNGPNLKQAILPKSCQIIANKNGSAVGFYVRFNHCDIYCTPGVPHELETMLIKQIVPAISADLPSDLITDVTRLQVFGLGESSLQKIINEQLPQWPTAIDLGFRAGMPLLEVKLTTNTKKGLALKPIWHNKLADVLGDHLISEIQDKPKSLAEHLLHQLQQHNLKVTTAESCTGGLIASKLTEISGSSMNFEAGYVTYSNKMKTAMLDVPAKLFEQYGAVSEQVVVAMAKGSLIKSTADLTIAVSGVAGPNGGTEEKPVGTVWLAWGSIDNIKTQCLLLPYKRVKFQEFVAAIGLDLLRRYQQNITSIPNYIAERAFTDQ
ncbi:CinA family nicotinamide mononucleotide deamidase-related protein [Colwellia psychrerythraea]|uniref:CinA-like protein n=1 Tax=Colwellia psychrerythraea (strain 34H / ATCC BAA-681) TaxID=167879 RepID=CINAL_COLP3|nr:CinA family nicotinamide mononucleotide deamidase-related protein [Colwellia psychrerythraea]Q47XX0.1 RecName: Full=CinA-like protein [Colwellia psychrerythraea 34H]AAZ25288.1 competence/damage-inducible protein CinA [Colwellia psychrerythraea 34H]